MDEIKLLKHYLTRYYRASQNRYILRDRLSAVRQKLRDTAMAAEIEERIRNQERETAGIMAEVIDACAFLPPDSYERMILELRHIDCKSWTAIQRALHLSPSSCYEHYRRGLGDLLEIDGIRDRIGLPPKQGPGP